MIKKFDGVVFDLDGTLYPNYRFYISLIPFILQEYSLLWAFGKARSILRATQEQRVSQDSPQDTFYDLQAQLVGEILRIDPGTIKERIEKRIYQGWEPLFKKIKPYPYVGETLRGLQKEGFKLGILSDFPPEMKLKHLNLTGFWDIMLCSEWVGALKPDPRPFLDLSKKLEIPRERLLYVGNSVKYDIIGAKRTGMKAALVSPAFWKCRRHNGDPDFIFSDYRQLYDYVLN